MKSTPPPPSHNPELLAMIPPGLGRVVDVGCSTGLLAAAYRAQNPHCEFIGIEMDPEYAEVAKRSCSRVLCADIATLPADRFDALFPSDCWVFGDVLEHLRDPWALLQRIRERLPPTGHVVACIPNMQHWSVQARLLTGELRYEDFGLLDRTHLRWFTRITMLDLFEKGGFRVQRGASRVLRDPRSERGLAAVRVMAQALGHDPELAARDANVFQWVIHAQPA